MSENVDRVDPTCFLPDEPMVYEIKKKKKKKKKNKDQEDPLKDVIEVDIKPPVVIQNDMDPEVTIKVENIEVELDFNEFTNQHGLMVQGPNSEDNSQEPAVPIQDRHSHDAVILTFENVVNGNHSIFNPKVEPPEEERHTCSTCHLVFKTERTLHLHERRKHKSHKKSFKFICDDCGLSYDNKNSLIAHTRRKHGKDSIPEDREERICEICALVFKGMMRLRMHMQRKHGSFVDTFKHECYDCGLTYDKYRSLLVHQKRKHSKTANKIKTEWFNCPLCPKIFTNRDTYVRHVQRKHNNDQDKKIPKEFLDNLADATTAGEIPCRECPLVFSNTMYLKMHMRRKHNAFKDDFRLKCKICNLSYDKVESLKRHVRRKHNNGAVCDVCNKQFESTEAFLNHTHDKPIIECSICGLIFASQGGLQKHLRCTHKIDFGPKTVFCHMCNEGFYENRQLKVHLMKVHLNVSYPCKFCKKNFKSKESYRRHVQRYHSASYPQNKLDHPCSMCDNFFSNELDLCRHINLAHIKQESSAEVKKEVKKELDDEGKESADSNQKFHCTKCPEKCSTWEALRKHYEQKHLVVNETQCQACGDIVMENELAKHMKTAHPVEVSMKCPYCEFETTSKVSLTQHTLRHKNATTLTCDYEGCRYKSYFQAAMDKHKKRHAELGVKLQCSKCPFQTMNKYILRYHEEVHLTGKKRYVCNECDYATILPANLVQHKYKHSTVKRFKCEYCPFATKYNTSLRFHVKKKHCDLTIIAKQ